MTATAVLAAGCSGQLPCPGQKVEAFGLGDLNPLKWLGNAASKAVGDVWLSAMTGPVVGRAVAAETGLQDHRRVHHS